MDNYNVSEKCFVTGGSGFIGRNLISLLIKEGFEVIALARSKRSAEIVESLGARSVNGGIDNIESLKIGMKGVSVVFHLAGYVDTWGDYKEIYNVNVNGTKNVIDAAIECGVKRMVHISSTSVVLDGKPKFNIDETYKLKSEPRGMYQKTKLIAENLVLKSNSQSLETIVIRPSWVWGKGDTSVLEKVMKTVKEKKFVWISNGNHIISTTHVFNLCSAIILAYRNGKGGEVYFITDGEDIPFKDFMGRMIQTQGKSVDNAPSIPRAVMILIARLLEFFHTVFSLKTRPLLDCEIIYDVGASYKINDNKARTQLGYRNVITINEGLKNMME